MESLALCPYVMVTRQDCDPKRMSPLNRKNLAEYKTTALYRAWKGQLFIQDQRVCDLALRSPYSGTIPAHLPAKLEAKYAVAVSDLRKKLPAVAFGKSNYANDEVHSQGILFSLYEVETLNQNEPKVDQLIESLKEKDLALVRYLNERGLFILLTSSALAKEKDSAAEESPRLQALFVISSPRPTRLTAKDLRCDHGVDERSSQVSSLLPALRYALAEAAKDLKARGVPLGVRIKQHVQEVAALDKNFLPTFTHPDRPFQSFDQFLKKSDLEAVSGKCSQKSFARLERYLSTPQNYTLEMSVASACSDAGSLSPHSSRVCDTGPSLGLRSSPLPREGPAQLAEAAKSGQSAESTSLGADGAGKPSRASERNLQRCKRKSSRLLGVSTRKKWAPLKVLCIMESSKKRKKSKKKKQDLSSASSKTQGPSSDSGEPTLKLKNLQYPLRRKRGAEVLSAEFVHRTRHESATKATSSSEVVGAEQKKPRLISGSKNMEVEKAEKVNESRTGRKKCIVRNADAAESDTHGDENAPSGEQSAPPSPLKRDECDSHALNMLADLALSSCDSLLVTSANRSASSHSLSREQRHLQRETLLNQASDHEYHRMNAKSKGTSLPSRSPQRSHPAPVQPQQGGNCPFNLRERVRVGSAKKKGTKPHPASPHAALPTETGDISDPISTEHSYASLAPESSPGAKNGVKSTKSGPFVGRVLPFRHQQNICHPHKQFRIYLPFSRSAVMAARPKEDFGKSRKVTFCDQSVQVTCQWENKYLFGVDSKYTNNSLEKTIIRAVHGPWDLTLSDDVEEMKLILHMWVALFYSRPFRSPTARKVVEHSNPAKYVSLNSIVDPFPLADDGDGHCDLDKHSADSFSVLRQMPDKVEEDDCFPVEEPLSCNELTSTNCMENEAPVADPMETCDLPLKDRPVGSFASDSSLCQASDKVLGKESKDKVLPEPVIPHLSQSTDSLNGQGRDFSRPDRKAEVETVNSVEVPQSDFASLLPEQTETTKDTQGETDTGSAISTEKLEINNASPSAKGDSCQIGNIESLPASGATWLEADAEYEKDKSPCRGEADLQDFPVGEDEEDVVELGSLALSDSNDTDGEPRDVDLDHDNEELAQDSCDTEETCVYEAPSSDDSLTTLTPSLAGSLQQSDPEKATESPGDQEDAGLAPKSEFLNQMDSVEASCVSRDSKRDELADLRPPQAVPFHPIVLDKETGSAATECAVESPKLPPSPNQTDLVEHSTAAQEDKETCLADSVSLRATEPNRIKNNLITRGDSLHAPDPNQIKNDLVTQGDVLGLGKSLTFSNPFDLDCVSEGGKDASRDSSTLQETYPTYRPGPPENAKLLGNQEDAAMPTKHPVSPIPVIVIEDESQEEIPVAQSAREQGRVQNSKLTGEVSVNDSLISAPNLASAVGSLVRNSFVSREEKGILDPAPLPNHLADRTVPIEGTTVVENEEDSVATSALSPALPEPVSSDGGSRSDREEEDMTTSDTHPLEASSGVVQGEQKTGQISGLPNDAVEDEEIQFSGLNGGELGANWKGSEPRDTNENHENVSTEEEEACADRLAQDVATMSEEIKSLLCELLDTVSGLELECEGACSAGDSGLNWMGSMTLECVTPPESDEESRAADRLNASDPKSVVAEQLEKQGIFVTQEAESREDNQRRPTSDEVLSSPQAAGVENEAFEDEKAASAAVDVLTSCEDRTESGTPSLDSNLETAETAISSKSNDSAISTYEEVELGPASREAPVLAREGGLSKEGDVEILGCVPGGSTVEYVQEESDRRLHAGTSHGQERGDPKDLVDVQLTNEQAEPPTRILGPCTNSEVESLSADDSPLHGGPSQGQKRGAPKDLVDVQLTSEQEEPPTKVLGPYTNSEVESLSADDDQELFEDPFCRNPTAGGSYTRSTSSRGGTGAISVCDLSTEEEVGRSDDRVHFGKKTRSLDEPKCFDWPFTSRWEDRPAPPPLRADGEPGPTKGYVNFSITKRHKDKTRTFHSSKRGDSFTDESGLINSWSRTWQVLDDPVQSTLDMECLRFHYKLKHILKRKRPQLSTSGDPFANEFATQVIAETLPLRKVPEGPVLNLPPRSRSPLLVTIANPSARQSTAHRYPRISTPNDSFDPPPLPRDPCNKAARCRSRGQERPAPFHLNKLTYNNKLKDCRGDISVIMAEFSELSRVMNLDDRQTGNKGQTPGTTSEDIPEKRCQSLPGRRASYEHLFDDLCHTIHFRLKNVAKEACKNSYSFYLVEMDDDSFFGRIKNLLKKGGHLETDPQLFCKASHPETDRLVVIIRNEDIFSHIHKIPSLLRLKHFRNVTFAGVDSPEDILDHTYQELFHSGGFVVSDDQVLETMTTGELKDVVKTLELLNGHQKWRWFLHHKETKKLRENARVDPTARSKDSILRSCQGASFTEVLHYHRCDSRSAPRAEYLNCLLNLQVQHITARLAIFLTENPSASREAFESKGILVLDVNTFVATAEDLATSCRSNY